MATRVSAGTDTAQQRVPTDTTSTDPNATPTLVAALSMNALAMHDAATAGLDDDDFGFDDDCTWSQLVVNPGGSVRPQTPAASVTAAAEPAASKPGPAVPPPKRKRRVLRQHGTDTSVISHQSCHSQDKTKHVLEPINDEDRGEVEVIVLEDLPEPVVDKTTIPPEKRPPSVMPCTYGSCVTAPEVMVRSQERILETLPPGWLKTAILMSEKGPHKPTIKLTTTCSGCDELPALLCCLLDTVHRMGNVPIDQRREVEQPLACEKVEWKQDHIQNKPDDSPWPIKPQQLVADCWHLASTKTVSAHNAHARQYAHALVTSETMCLSPSAVGECLPGRRGAGRSGMHKLTDRGAGARGAAKLRRTWPSMRGCVRSALLRRSSQGQTLYQRWIAHRGQSIQSRSAIPHGHPGA